MKANGAVSILAAAVCLLMTCTAWGRVIYVDDDAPTGGNGASWARAYRFLQDALAEADNSEMPIEIRMAQGIYKPDTNSAHPDGTGDRAAGFCLLEDVSILGGFAGLGTPDPNIVDIALYETVLTGDLAGDDVAVFDACDLLAEPSRDENSYAVVTAAACSRSAVLCGVVVTSGSAMEPQSGQQGAGLLLSYYGADCCPSIRDCTFRGNRAYHGGAAFVIGAAPEFVHCRFLQNAAMGGGAIRTSAWRGPWTTSACDLAIRGCAFAGNHALDCGGAIHMGAGGPFTIEASSFTKNVARTGGAMYVSVRTSLTGCLFSRNAAYEGGGAVYSNGYELNIASCTFADNAAPAGMALVCLAPRTTITNTICRNGGDDRYGEILIGAFTGVSVTYSDIHGGWSGEGNIDLDPLFASPAYWDPNGTVDDPSDDFFVEGDYHLKSQAGRWDPNGGSWVQDDVTSPCIDAGDPNSPIGEEPFPNGGRINMGAYGGTAQASKSYFGEPVSDTIIAGDINGDGKVDWKDLEILSHHWLQGYHE
ncbi:MAG: right-handed parallel beta-helix repeat-containing protein [Phycisphaerales bacterium]